jgi:hypothetical protein
MRHLSRVLPGVALAALILCVAAVTATAAVRGDGHGKDDKDKGPGKAAPAAPAAPTAPQAAATTPPGPPATPPGQAKKTTPPPPAPTPPGQAKKAPVGASTTPGTTPTTGDAQPASGQPAEPTPVPPVTAPVMGESMGLKPAGGTVQVRLPNSSGYVSLAAAGSVPSGAVVDARRGTVLLRSAVDAAGRTQTATVRGAIFEVRQAADGKGMTDLVLRPLGAGPPRALPHPRAQQRRHGPRHPLGDARDVRRYADPGHGWRGGRVRQAHAPHRPRPRRAHLPRAQVRLTVQARLHLCPAELKIHG